MRNLISRSFLVGLVFLFLMGCGGGGGGNSVPVTQPSATEAPLASFTTDVVTGTAPLLVKFTDTSTKSPTSWLWNFGDGATSVGQNPSHTYITAGTYVVNQTAGNAAGNSNAQFTVVVTTTPVVVQPPVADFTVNAMSGSAPFAVTTVNTSTGNPTSHSWTYGDGATSALQSPAQHTYLLPGVYSLSLTESNAGGSNSKSVTITVTEALPRVKTVGFQAITDAEYTELITVAVNADFAAIFPAWSQTAKTFFEVYINSILAKNTKKRYIVGQLITYSNAEVATMSGSSRFYLDNNFTSGAGGTTVFVYAYANVASIPSQFLVQGPNGPVGASSNFLTVNGKPYSEVWIVEEGVSSCLLGKNVVDTNHGAGSFEGVAMTYLHELGHTLGLARDEWYRYEFDDLTGELPYLGVYSRAAQYQLDPMTCYWISGINSQFAPINAKMIDLNANHQYNNLQIWFASPADITVKVIDVVGNPIQGATVKTFGKRVIDQQMRTALENLTTDASGKVQIKANDWTTYVAKALKASKAGKYAGMYLTLTDLEIVYLMQGLDSVTYTLKIQ